MDDASSFDQQNVGEPHHSGPLKGLKIVEFAGIGPGPFAAMLLADMGAEVIRLDRPGGADPYVSKVIRRGRANVVVDLKSLQDRTKVLTLLDRADALIEGYRPGVMERLGLGPDVVLERNPRLVYGRMTGWGQAGPLAHAAGHDINYIGLAGALHGIGPRTHPVPPLNLVGDYGGGSLYLVCGLLAGILSARQTGVGQVVDAAIVDGAASLMSIFYALRAEGNWRDERGVNMLDGGRPFYRTYECADGRFISVGALEPQFYAELRERAGQGDPIFAAQNDAAARDGQHARWEEIFRTKTRDEWCAVLEGTDACFAPVLTLAEAPRHPQISARETYVEVDGVVQPAPAPRFSATPTKAGPVPTQPTPLDDILAAWAGERVD